jgi:hypothetical protein
MPQIYYNTYINNILPVKGMYVGSVIINYKELSEAMVPKQHENIMLNLELLGIKFKFICFGTQLVSEAFEILGYRIQYPAPALVNNFNGLYELLNFLSMHRIRDSYGDGLLLSRMTI